MKAQGVSLGSVSPTYFLAGSGDGSLSSQDKNTRQRYIEQTILAAWIAAELGNGSLSLWFPDGSNYPGERGLGEKLRLLRDSLAETWEILPMNLSAM